MNQYLGPWALLLQLGWTISLSIVGSLLIGVWVDRTLGTSPIGVLFFSLVGILVGSMIVYRQVSRAIAAAAEEQPRKKYHKVDYGDKEDADTKEDE
ncbi:MAG: AtpZ/AtpI family protein [Chloroflexi bacterium]|nr:AtpZ/AtpI family protein [Chloroflexota bacterium]